MKLTSHPKLVLPSALVLAVAFNLSGLAFSFQPGCVKFSESLKPGILTDYATEVLEDAAFGRGETAPLCAGPWRNRSGTSADRVSR